MAQSTGHGAQGKKDLRSSGFCCYSATPSFGCVVICPSGVIRPPYVGRHSALMPSLPPSLQLRRSKKASAYEDALSFIVKQLNDYRMTTE